MRVFKFSLLFSVLILGFTDLTVARTPGNATEDKALHHIADADKTIRLNAAGFSLTAANSLEAGTAGNITLTPKIAFKRVVAATFSLAATATEGDDYPISRKAVVANAHAASVMIQKQKNKAPKAHAGKNQQLTDDDNDGKEVVQLDGSESEDKDGQITSYNWSIEGANTTLATGVKPTVELPVGSTWIELTVTDDGGLTDTGKVKITIRERKGGDDGEEDEDDGGDNNEDDDGDDSSGGNDGDEGNDDEGEGEDEGDNDDDTSVDEGEGGDDNDDEGEGEGDGDTSIDEGEDNDEGDDEVEEDDDEEESDNKAPKAHAGKDQELTDDDNDGKETVQLDGSESEAREEGASIVSYSWSVEGTNTVLATGVTPTVELPVGKTAIVLTVTDDNGLTDNAKVNIHIKEAKEKDNKAPKAHAGKNQELTDDDNDGKETVQLDGSESEDKDGTIVSYIWSVEGTDAELATGVSPTVELPVGSTWIELTVIDDGGLTDTAKVKITIREGEGNDEGDEDEDDGGGDNDEEGDGDDSSGGNDGDEDNDDEGEGEDEGDNDDDTSVDEGEGGDDNDDEGEGEGDGDDTGVDEGEDGDDDGNNNGDDDNSGDDDGDNNGDDDDGGNNDAGEDGGNEDGGDNDDDGSNDDGSGEGDNGGGDEDDNSGGGNDNGGNDDSDGGNDDAGEDSGGDEGEEGPEPGGTAFLPNLFSPNGDQMNDAFILHATNIEKIHWRIYNRQGRLVYETRDLEEATQTGWDGTAFGAPQPEGSYVWILEGIYKNGTPVLIEDDIKGSVTLIR